MFAIQQMLHLSKDSLSSPTTAHSLTQPRTPPPTPSASTSAPSPSLGLVKVMCRLRPCLAHEESSAKSVVQVINRSQIRITDPVKNLVNRFDFSACYGESSTQQQIFDAEVRDMVMGVFSGITATIFTFGCTGSGKTHTLQGSPADPGIAPRAVRTVFEHINRLGGGLGVGQTEYRISLSCFEIWKDKVWDLLAEGGTAATRDLGRGDLPIREASNGQVFVPNLCRVPLSDCARFDKLYDQVMGARSVSSTKLNHASSRSHAILTIYVSQLRAGKSFEGKCVLIDLAGSENNKKTGNDTNKERMKESVEINQSLLTLRKVVRSLNAGDVRIPYRDSKLTRILSDSLGGTSAGLVICNVAPHASQYRDTMNTLNFGSNARNVENKVALKLAGSAGKRQLRPLGNSLYQQNSKSAPHLPLPRSASSTISPPKLNWPRHPALASLPNQGLPLPNSPARAASDFGNSLTPPFSRRPAPHMPPPSFKSGGSQSVLPSRSMSPVLSVESSTDSALEGQWCRQSNSSDYSVAAAELERRVNVVIEKNMDELVHKRVDALLDEKLKQAGPGRPTSESGRGHPGGGEEESSLVERIATLEQQFQREHQQLASNRHPASATLNNQDPKSTSLITLVYLNHWVGEKISRSGSKIRVNRLRSGVDRLTKKVEWSGGWRLRC